MITQQIDTLSEFTLAPGPPLTSGSKILVLEPAQIPADLLVMRITNSGPAPVVVQVGQSPGGGTGLANTDPPTIQTVIFRPVFGTAAPTTGSTFLVVPWRGGRVILSVFNLHDVDSAEINWTVDAVTTGLAAADLLPAHLDNTASFGNAPIAAGQTLGLGGWTQPGYRTLHVAGTCTQAWAIDAVWHLMGRPTAGTGQQEHVTFTETLAAGPAGLLTATVPMRTSSAQINVRNTSGAAGTITATSRLER